MVNEKDGENSTRVQASPLDDCRTSPPFLPRGLDLLGPALHAPGCSVFHGQGNDGRLALLEGGTF